MEFEDGSGNSKTAGMPIPYTNTDNTWQELTIYMSNASGGDFNLADGVKNLVFITGAGNRVIELDEIRFERP